MAIYEKYVGRSRDSFASLKDAQQNYRIDCPEDFNFAYDVVDVLGREKPDKRAILWLSKDKEEKTFTFRDVSRLSDRAANMLYSLGVRKGDRGLLGLKRHWSFWILLCALHKIGAVMVQATSMLTAKDYVYRCNAGKIGYVIITGDDGCPARFDEGADRYETVKKKLIVGDRVPDGWLSFDKLFAGAKDEWTRPSGDAATRADDIMMMCFSSGTTGYPKIITHDFRYPLGHIMTGVFWHRCVDGGLHFTVSDTGWMKALWGKVYGQWMAESAVLVYDFERFHADDILSVVQKYKVTTFCVPPTMYRMLLQTEVEKYDLSSVTHCCTAGEALGPEIYSEWLRRTGHKIYEGFGQSETPVMLATIYPWSEPEPGSIGFPVPGYDVMAIDEDCVPVPRGVTGEICVKIHGRRPCGLLCGYNFNKEETDHAFRGGFYHTGDTAYLDEHGRYRYVGRNDDIIKSSGYRIGPFEIESVLNEHPAVLETAVTGVPDPDGIRGFLVKATVVLRPGFEGTPELVKELQNYVKKNTAPYKYPRVVEFVKELPKTFSGKVRRAEIRRRDSEKK